MHITTAKTLIMNCSGKEMILLRWTFSEKISTLSPRCSTIRTIVVLVLYFLPDSYFCFLVLWEHSLCRLWQYLSACMAIPACSCLVFTFLSQRSVSKLSKISALLKILNILTAVNMPIMQNSFGNAAVWYNKFQFIQANYAKQYKRTKMYSVKW